MIDVYNEAVTLTPSNSANLGRLTDAVYIGGAGTLAAVLQNDVVATFTVSAPYLLPLRAKRVNATGTSATLLLALYQT